MKSTLLFSFLLLGFSLSAQEKEADHSGANAQANNPLANMTALNFHNYYTPKLTEGPPYAFLNTAWVRFAKPFASGKLLLRVSAPISTISFPDSTGFPVNTNGLGDVNAFLSYNFISKPNATLGIGPMLTGPTASEDALGTGKWQAGFAFVAFVVKSPQLQLGGLVTWQTSIAGEEDRADACSFALQPFYFWQLGKGVYIRGAPIWYFDLENDNYNVPYALGIGKVVNMGNTVFNLFVEPQYTMLSDGVQPQFQLFTGINIQFINNSQ